MKSPEMWARSIAILVDVVTINTGVYNKTGIYIR